MVKYLNTIRQSKCELKGNTIYLASKSKVALLDIVLKNGSFKICGNTL